MRLPWRCLPILLVTTTTLPSAPFERPQPNQLRVATYNLENYLHTPRGTRPAKPDPSRDRIADALKQLNADVIALQEIGGPEALADLGTRLIARGLLYPYVELVDGYDTNIFVAVLSRYPFAARRSHPNERFLLRGRRLRTTRGIAEVDITVPPSYHFTLMAVHLKSRLDTGEASQEEIREQEALVLRRLLDARLRVAPEANVVMLGDFNDYHGSRTLRTVRGRGNTALMDTRPAERNPNTLSPDPAAPNSRNTAWTHFYSREDVYSRVDYILLSPGMAREWDPSNSYVLAFPNWGEASDHRPLVATFVTRDR